MNRFSGTVIPAPFKISRWSENMYVASWKNGIEATVSVNNGQASCHNIDATSATIADTLSSAYAHCAAFNVQARLK